MKSYLKKLMSCLIACVFIFWGTSCKDDGPAAALDNGEFYTIEMYLPVQSATTPLDMDVVEEELNKTYIGNVYRHDLIYKYYCKCGQITGEKYGSHIAEAHHIDYFVNSLNNDANNQMIVCPNHHSVIHDANPVFNRKRMIYRFANGIEEKIKVNKHLM